MVLCLYVMCFMPSIPGFFLCMDFICLAILKFRGSLRSRPPRNEGIGPSSFPPSAEPTLGGTHWDDNDDDDEL